MKRKILWLGLSFLLVAALALASCGLAEGEGEQEEEVVLPTAQEIIDGVISSLDTIKSHNLDTDISLEMAGEAEIVEMSMAMVFSGAIDLENKEMSMNLAASSLMPGGEWEAIMEIYIVDDMYYGKTEMSEMEPVWEKEEFSEADWGFVTGVFAPIESHLDLLELAAISVIGSEEVNGVDCYVLQLTPNLEDLWETATHQIVAFDQKMPAFAEDALEEAFINLSVKQWVTKDTYFLTKSEIDISMEVTPKIKEVMGAEGMTTMDIAVSLLAYDHNKPVSIVLPPEALELEEEEEEKEGPQPVEEEDGVTFPDKNLDEVIRNALGKQAGGKITSVELANEVWELNADQKGITDLTGIEYCKNLSALYLFQNQISDISALSSLINLNNIVLDGNLISDLSPLSSLTNLTAFSIVGNQVTDISALSSLINLKGLDLGGNTINNLSPLSSLTNLSFLKLDSNQISDILPLVDNIGIAEGDTVILKGNPLSSISLNTYIPQLENRGVTVELD